MTDIFIRRRNLDTETYTGRTLFEYEDDHLRAKERSMKPIPASQSSEEISLLTCCSSTSSPQNCETLCFCHLSHLVVVLILQQPKKLIRHPQRKMSSQTVGSSLTPYPRRCQSSILISACSWGLCHHGHSCFRVPLSRWVFSVPRSNDSSMKFNPFP